MTIHESREFTKIVIFGEELGFVKELPDFVCPHGGERGKGAPQGNIGHRPETHQLDLKRCLFILNALIFESRVEGGIPSLAAAPVGPDTCPWASASAASIAFFSSEGGILK